jgi:hypothetical protein
VRSGLDEGSGDGLKSPNSAPSWGSFDLVDFGLFWNLRPINGELNGSGFCVREMGEPSDQRICMSTSDAQKKLAAAHHLPKLNGSDIDVPFGPEIVVGMYSGSGSGLLLNEG